VFPSPSLSTGLHAAGPFPSGPAATILICLVVASGVAFGIAAQISLQRLGLDFDSIRSDVIAHRAATPHFAIAWWCWWLVALGAFLVGPLCAVAIRAIGGSVQPMRGLPSFATALAALGLAAVAQPRAFPLAATVGANAVVSLLVVIGSAVLALLGTRLLGGISHDWMATPLEVRVGGRLRELQGSTPCPAIPLRSSGLPVLRTRVKVLTGSPGKRPLNQAEPMPEIAVPECPPELGPVARREWDRVVGELAMLWLLTNLDRAALAAYCGAYALWAESMEAIQKYRTMVKSPSGYPIQSPYVAIANRQAEIIDAHRVRIRLYAGES
jgi:P27 family predicted phage terminase small subunit